MSMRQHLSLSQAFSVMFGAIQALLQVRPATICNTHHDSYMILVSYNAYIELLSQLPKLNVQNLTVTKDTAKGHLALLASWH